VVSDGHHFFGDLQHLGEQLFALLTVRNVSSQVHNQAAVAPGFFKHEGGNVHPQPLARTCLDLQVKIGSVQLLRSALLDAAIADTDLRSQA
jgi:hypothetical protein